MHVLRINVLARIWTSVTERALGAVVLAYGCYSVVVVQFCWAYFIDVCGCWILVIIHRININLVHLLLNTWNLGNNGHFNIFLSTETFVAASYVFIDYFDLVVVQVNKILLLLTLGRILVWDH